MDVARPTATGQQRADGTHQAVGRRKAHLLRSRSQVPASIAYVRILVLTEIFSLTRHK